jgi:Matrixin
MKRTVATLALVVIAALLVFYSAPAPSFVPQLTNGNNDKWTATPTFIVNPSTGANISGTASVTTVIADGFQAWTSAPNTSLQAINGGTTQSTAIGFNSNPGATNTNLICFVSTCTVPGGFGKGGDTLAITLTTTNSNTGQILDADMVFNPAVSFLTDPVTPPVAPQGQPQTQSLQTVATHEIGHFFGLDHSGVIRSIMFPQAPPLQLKLSYDDVIGISTNYPGVQSVPTGTITGTIRNGNGTAVFGAHVFAESVTNSAPFGSSVRKSPIDTLSRPDGTYSITVPAVDSYNVTAEPEDGPADNSNFDWAGSFGQAALNTNFTTRQH